MANQEVRTNGQTSNEQSNQVARSSGSTGLSRGWQDPFLPSPSDFFNLNPFSLMRRMSEEMDRAFGGFGMGRGRESGSSWMPAIEVAERDGKYMIHADVPGLKPEDVKVEVTDDALIVQGERKFEHEENRGGIQRSERRYGHFYRSVPLPQGVKADEIQAKFENGVLEVTAPLPPQQSERRQIPIQAGGSSRPNA